MKKILILALFGAFLLSCNESVDKETDGVKKEKEWNQADYENEKAEI